MKHCDVLFLVRSLNAGGAERQLVLLAKALSRRGIRVSVAQFYGGGIFADELVLDGVPLFDLRKGGRWPNLGFLWRLWRLLRLLRPKVAHGYLSGANLILLLLKPVLIRQGTSVVCGVRSSYDPKTNLIERLHRRALRFSDAVICNSEAGARSFSIGHPDSSGFHMVDNGIDTERFRFDEAGRRALRSHWKVPNGAPLIGLVGRHDPVKDHALFLSAAARVASQIPEVRFVIVGGEVAAITPDLKIRAEELGISKQIIWAGHHSELSPVYSALDVLCLCSKREGFPNVVAEAMSCGLPCVCTDVGDVHRLVGDLGWVVKGREVEDLALALQQAIAALLTWDHESPRRRIISHFGVDNLADRTLSVLNPFLHYSQ
jgi:glycosyltransferase involved in cell wall biosynthesis